MVPVAYFVDFVMIIALHYTWASLAQLAQMAGFYNSMGCSKKKKGGGRKERKKERKREKERERERERLTLPKVNIGKETSQYKQYKDHHYCNAKVNSGGHEVVDRFLNLIWMGRVVVALQ